MGDDTGEAALRHLHRAHGRLVVAGSSVLTCDCGGAAEEGRRVGVAGERRDLGTAGEERQVGTAGEGREVRTSSEGRQVGTGSEEHRVGTASEDRQVGTGRESREVGSALEERRVGTASEERQLVTADEILACTEVSWCSGFLVSGAGPLQVFDGVALHDVRYRCVPAPQATEVIP